MVSPYLKEALVEANFGEITYRVVFGTLECKRTNFSVENCPGVAELIAIERYGCALRVAREIMRRGWVLTKEGFIICTDTDKPVPILRLNINLDENAEALARYDVDSIRDGTAVPVAPVEGLDVNVGKRPWLWCVFK